MSDFTREAYAHYVGEPLDAKTATPGEMAERIEQLLLEAVVPGKSYTMKKAILQYARYLERHLRNRYLDKLFGPGRHPDDGVLSDPTSHHTFQNVYQTFRGLGGEDAFLQLGDGDEDIILGDQFRYWARFLEDPKTAHTKLAPVWKTEGRGPTVTFGSEIPNLSQMHDLLAAGIGTELFPGYEGDMKWWLTELSPQERYATIIENRSRDVFRNVHNQDLFDFMRNSQAHNEEIRRIGRDTPEAAMELRNRVAEFKQYKDHLQNRINATAKRLNLHVLPEMYPRPPEEDYTVPEVKRRMERNILKRKRQLEYGFEEEEEKGPETRIQKRLMLEPIEEDPPQEEEEEREVEGPQEEEEEEGLDQ